MKLVSVSPLHLHVSKNYLYHNVYPFTPNDGCLKYFLVSLQMAVLFRWHVLNASPGMYIYIYIYIYMMDAVL